ncbi:MAG: PEGA domain-containing protein [Leptospiraceae bacterium]|nr:PEGA domain-containing protein [Leptospiraceae bacterium]MCP5503085.1 PEGA domain-containing protein [Leptospiraceae bacterium]
MRFIFLFLILFFLSCKQEMLYRLQSEPSGVNVVDIVQNRVIGTTPLIIRLQEKEEKKFLLEMEGYKVKELDLSFKKEAKEENLKIKLEKNLNVSLESKPEGAEVSVDGKVYGITPIRFELKQGEHKIQVARQGFKAEIFTVNIQFPEQEIIKTLTLLSLKDLEDLKKREEEEKRKAEEESFTEFKEGGVTYHRLKGYSDSLVPIALIGTNEDAQIVREKRLYWGPYEGEMGWKEAVERCKTKRMQLPSRKELNLVAKSNLGKIKTPCCKYWSSESHPDSEDAKYYVSVSDGQSVLHPASYSHNVRCIVYRWIRVSH